MLLLKRLLKLAGWGVLAVLMSGAPSVVLASGPDSQQALEPAIAAYLEPLLRTNNFAGVVLIARGDTIIFEQGYGLANVEMQTPHTARTRFHIASVSKPFTSAAIMLLAEKGQIDLDAPLTAILPDYPNGERLTVHHLLTHTSGIPNINDFPDFTDFQRRPQTTASLVAHFKGRPLESEPGAEFSYSNSNYNLLAHIIEVVAGQTYGDFLRREVFSRLAMTGTGHPVSANEIVSGLADGYAPEGDLGLERAAYLDWSVKTGNGSLYSDAAGLLRFFRAIHSGELLNDASRAATFTPHTPNVGYGWFMTRANNRDIHHINGRSPGWAAQADYYPADEVTVIVLSNLYVSVTTPIARAVGAIYFGEPHERMPELSGRLPADRTAPLLGVYQFGPDYYVPNAAIRVTDAAGLSGEYTTHDYPAFAFVPTGGNTFLVRPFWISAEFSIGPAGEADALLIDGLRGVRVDVPEAQPAALTPN